MKIVKNLSKANIRPYAGFERREDLDFSDDGNYFRGFSYKGMPITTLRTCDETYLSIRVDYLTNEFTYNEWMETEEYRLADKYNGVSSFDIDELVANVERIIAKVAEMNEAMADEVIDVKEVQEKLTQEIYYAEAIVEKFKEDFKWYEVETWKLSRYVDYLKSLTREAEEIKKINFDSMSRKEKKSMVDFFKRTGYVRIGENNFYVNELLNALK